MAKKRKKVEEPPKGGGMDWLLTFSDVLTLMITFFVLLISMSSMDNKRLKETIGFFLKAIGALQGGPKGRSTLTAPSFADQRLKPMPLINKNLRSETGGMTDQVQHKLKLLIHATRELAERLAQARTERSGAYGVAPLKWEVAEFINAAKAVKVTQLDHQMAVDLHLRLLFVPGSTRLRQDAQVLAAQLRAITVAHAPLVRVDTPIAETGAEVRLFSRWELAAWRSAALVRLVAPKGKAAAGAVAEQDYVRFVLALPATRINRARQAADEG